MKNNISLRSELCSKNMLALQDTMNILHGKWKISILLSLNEHKKRFKELQRDIGKITGKMLSKELKELEMNELIIRTVLDTQPFTVEYELTSYGTSLEIVIDELVNWGIKHRKRIMRKGK
jgi:DNA-binding HxlR family transcriptional regulator